MADGVLMQTWEVHCGVCQRANLGLRGKMVEAIKELRRDGWATRQGLWVCEPCAELNPPGTKIVEVRR